jgi:tetraacyldisaccharide 4'-kinase
MTPNWKQKLALRLQREWYEGGPLTQVLRPLAGLYRLLLNGRGLLYRCGVLRVAALPVPVIVVGNWIVGGAGKTPTTLALLSQLQGLGLRAGVISRGYGRSGTAPQLVSAQTPASAVGDEPLLIYLRAGVPVAVGRDRVAAARLLLAAHPELQLLVSDDGLQHLRLPRALSVLVFDERGVGNGRLLPAGPLRQTPERQVGPDQLVLYNADRPSTALPGYLARRSLGGAVSLSDWWQGMPATTACLRALGGRPLLATAGMAQPQRFFSMLLQHGLNITELPLADHYDFAQLPWPTGTADVLLTEKDAVKIDPMLGGKTRVWVVALDFVPEQAFQQALRGRLQQQASLADLLA